MPIYSNSELISDKTVDAVHICTPNKLHSKLSILSMEHGKHVLVEKPMALKLSDCKKMNHVAKKMNVKLMIGHTYRFYPSSLAVKKIIDFGLSPATRKPSL